MDAPYERYPVWVVMDTTDRMTVKDYGAANGLVVGGGSNFFANGRI
jgi:hypothetical protein